jgi:hypothetical protein
MSDAPEEELAAALRHLAARRGSLGRWDAREVLVPLGRLVLARGADGCAEDLQRVRAAVGPAQEAWEAAVREELSLACAEHIQGTDPRFIGLPNFDWDYVLEARERLEARAAAARALGGEPPAGLWGEVLAADRRVEVERRRRTLP